MLVCGALLALATFPAVPSGAAAAQDADDAARLAADLSAPLPPDPAVVTGVLENGLTYYVRANREPENRAELRLVVNAGSILEDDDQLGLAHFVEHMAFNGTRNFEKQEIVDYLESIGMRFGPDVNAYTGFDETVYMLQVPMDDPEVLATAFRILGDWAGGVVFDPEEVEKERGVVIEEWRGRRGAGARMQDQQFPVVFQGSRYAERLPIGDPAIVENAPASALVRFYDDWYRPDLMAVVAVGDFEATAIVEMIADAFAELEGPAEPRPRIEAEVPVDHPPLVTIATDPEAGQSQVGVLYKRPPESEGTVGDYRRGLVRGLQSAMLNLRLGELRLSEDPPFVAAFAGSGAFARGVDAYQLAALVQEGGMPRGLDALLTEAERIVRHGFTATELERRRIATLRAAERALAEKDNRESASLAGALVGVFLDGGPYPSLETATALTRELLPGITVDEVNAAVEREWLAETGRVITASAPAREDVEPPSADELTGVFARVAAREIGPYTDEAAEAPLLAELPEGSPVVSEEEVAAVGVTIWELANGVRVVLKPTDFKDDEVRFSATSPGGTSLASDELHRHVFWASAVIGSSGVGDFDQVALAKKLTGKVARVSPSIGSLTEGLSGSASPQDLETALQLVYLWFHAPRLDESTFAAFRNMQTGVMGNAENDPGSVFADTVAQTMSQGHPRTMSQSRFLSILEEADTEAALDFYRDRFADASDFTFYFVGNFDPAGLRPLVERYLGALPDLGRQESWRDTGVDPPAGVIEKVVRKGVEPRSQTRIIFAGDAEYSREEGVALSALAAVLQIRLREVLREDLGGTYGVGVSGDLADEPDQEYSFSVRFGSAPERADELTAAVFDEIEKIKAEGPDAEDVEKVKESQRRSKEAGLRENGYWLVQLRAHERYGIGLEHIPSYEWIEGWTAEQLREVANRYLLTDRYARFTLLPEAVIP